MPEAYKGQFKKFKETSEEMMNDPLLDIKHSLLDEEEKFNAMDDDHAPLLFFSVETDSDHTGFCNIYGGITVRKTDNKVAMFFRYMYPDGTKKWTIMKDHKTGSVWINPPDPLPELKLHFLRPFQLAGQMFGGVHKINVLDFTGKEKPEEVQKRLIESDLVYIAKIDKKKKKIQYINGEKEK